MAALPCAQGVGGEVELMAGSLRIRVCAAAIAALTVAATAACTDTPPAEPQATERPFCEVAVPAAWQSAIDAGRFDSGGVSTLPLAVSRAGEVVAVRDDGDTRDVLLIGADKSVAEIYAVPDPAKNDVGFAAIDDRWIVIGVDRIPRGSNGVLPGLIRIDVLDRQGGPVRAIAQRSMDDYTTGRNAIDSVALFDGKVYWLAHDFRGDDTTTLSSFDLATGAVDETPVDSARDLRTSAAGLTWSREGPGMPQVKIDGTLPPAVAESVGRGQDRVSVATDGTAYAWLTGLDEGGTGVAWWSPDSGLVRVTGEVVAPITRGVPLVSVAGPYVVIERGPREGSDRDAYTAVVDTRSGAVAYLANLTRGADGGTIAVDVGVVPNKLVPPNLSVVRSDSLPGLAC